MEKLEFDRLLESVIFASFDFLCQFNRLLGVFTFVCFFISCFLHELGGTNLFVFISLQDSEP